MKTRKFLKRDISVGILRKAYLFFVPAFVAIAQCYDFHRLIFYLNRDGFLSTNGTVLDYFLYVTRGMEVYDFNFREFFTIPIYWFTLQIGISYFIAYYAHQDFVKNGRNLFLASKDRRGWWNSKCLWCIGAVFLYYLMLGGFTCLTALFYGAELRLSLTTDVVTRAFGIEAAALSGTAVLFVSFLLPCIITTGLCLLQILTGFFLTPVVSFACMCGVYVLSAYYTKWFMPGSFTMWLRSTMVTTKGVHPASGVILGVMLAVCVWYAGRMYFEEKDIL